LIEACGASLVYYDNGKKVYACQDISMEVRENEFLGILGPSGSGKSSLLYLLSGLKVPSEGEIRYMGVSLARLSDEARSKLRLKDFGFVFQQPYLLGYLTAQENVAIAGVNGDSNAQAMDLLDRLGLGDKKHRLPHELSGGERQRVCVARALLGHPNIIFADEPTAALDHRNGRHVVQLLNANRGRGSLVMVTHDPSMLEEADRVLHLSDGTIDSEDDLASRAFAQ
jgi:putative ABC transport system ATP-binding protein